MAVVPLPNLAGIPEATPQRRKSPATSGYSSPLMVAALRAMSYETGAGTRVAAQAEVDRGVYERPAVGPVEYSEGNIKKSVNISGPAGYNQRAVPIPNSPDDMSQEEYLRSMLKNDPRFRQRLRTAMSVPFQAFLNRPTTNFDYPSMAHNMSNNLLALSTTKKRK
jgi:hypothetical protein